MTLPLPADRRRAGGLSVAEPATDARPALVTALRPAWRGRGALQFGLDPARAVVVEGIDEASARLVLGLDGGRTGAEVLSDAAAARFDVAGIAALLDRLAASGVLVDAAAQAGHGGAAWAGSPARPATPGGAGSRPAVPGRLAPDHASLALLALDRGAGVGAAEDAVRRRRDAAVIVHGAGRVGATLAALLGAAGVGHVHVVDRGPVRPADLAPGGLAAADLHRARSAAAAAAVRRAAPEAATTQLPPQQLPDLVVVASTRPVESDLGAALHGARIPHLVAGVRETTAVVGPLVLPGDTSCLRCADLHRADRDPAWPLLAAQLTGRPPARDEPCDVALAAVAAGLAALQCLGHLAGETVPTRGGTLELALPGWRVRRRGWPPHPRCGCGAAVLEDGGASAQRGARREWPS